MALVFADYGRMSEFQHKPLELTKASNRVFRILPGAGTLSLSLHNVVVLLDHTAVSYMWGATEPSQTIFINGQRFVVRQNLHNFLHEMRRRGRRNLFWVDAICINQHDIAERNHQVRRMGSIYKSAKDVILWLGQGNDETSAFLDWCRFPELTSSDKYRGLIHQVSTNFWAMKKILDDLYWARTWIIQEVLLSRSCSRIVVGNSDMPWDLFASMEQQIESATQDRSLEYHLYGRLQGLLNTHACKFLRDEKYAPVLFSVPRNGTKLDWDHPISLLQGLLERFGRTSCSDVRDRVFALSMLLGEDSARHLELDYAVSMEDLADRLLAGYPSDSRGLLLSFSQCLQSILELKRPPKIPKEKIRDDEFDKYIAQSGLAAYH